MPTKSNDMKDLNVLLRVAHETLDNAQKDYLAKLKDKGFTEEFLWKLLDLTKTEEEKEKLKGLTLIQMEEMLEESGVDKAIMKEFYAKAGDYSKSYIDYCVETFQKMADEYNEILDGKQRLDDAEKDMDALQNKYIEKLNSTEYREAFEKHIAELRRMAGTTSDDKDKKDLVKALAMYDKSLDFSFLTDRLFSASAKTAEKEKSSIFKNYFDLRGGGYNIQRYQDKMKAMEFSPNLYRSFMNLEEDLLPEEYHPYNNFFLFQVMRYISHADTNSDEDTMYCKSILKTLSSVSLKTIGESELRDLRTAMIKFLDVWHADMTGIKVWEDGEQKVYTYDEYFKQHNELYKNHPKRKEIEETVSETERKKKLVAQIKEEYGPRFHEDMLFEEKDGKRVLKDLDKMLEEILLNKEKLIEARAEEVASQQAQIENTLAKASVGEETEDRKTIKETVEAMKGIMEDSLENAMEEKASEEETSDE